jgi:Short C-terminal domain
MRKPLGFVGVLIKCLFAVSVLALVLSIGGFITSQVRNAAPMSMPSADDSVSGLRAYGEVPIPGTATVHLPAGPVAITFHAVTVGIPEAGLPVPDLKLDINPPAGVADPHVTESMGGTTSFNNDAWRRVWIAQVTQEGDYQITTDGQVTAFISARLAFGHQNASAPSAASPSSPYGYLSRFSGMAFAAALVTLIGCVLALRVLAGRANSPQSQADLLVSGRPLPPSSGSAATYDAEADVRSVIDSAASEVPSDIAVAAAATPPTAATQPIARRLQELETLRDAGAISDAEYAARRQQIIAEI